MEGKKKKSGEVPRSVSPKTEADGPPPLVEFEDIAEETTVLSEHAVKSKETESADVRVEVAKEKVAFWRPFTVWRRRLTDFLESTEKNFLNGTRNIK